MKHRRWRQLWRGEKLLPKTTGTVYDREDGARVFVAGYSRYDRFYDLGIPYELAGKRKARVRFQGSGLRIEGQGLR